MIDRQGKEISRTQAINSLVRTRDVAGNFITTAIHAHEGNLAVFVDDRGNKYKLPQNVLVDAYRDFGAFEATSITLKEAWRQFGIEPFRAHNYLGETFLLTMHGISHERYGWPDQKFDFIEHLLAVKLAAPEPEIVETPILETPALETPVKLESDGSAQSVEGNWVQTDGGSEHFIPDSPSIDP